MLANLLASRPETSTDGYDITWLTLPEGLIYALIGFIVTFLGIVILIFCVWIYGKIIKGVREKSLSKKKSATVPQTVVSESDSDVPVEVRLAIIAAIAAYYENEKSSCEFKVKRIKRL